MLKKGIINKQIGIEVATESLQDFYLLFGRLINLKREKPVKGDYSQLSLLLFRVLDAKTNLGQVLSCTYLRTNYLSRESHNTII